MEIPFQYLELTGAISWCTSRRQSKKKDSGRLFPYFQEGIDKNKQQIRGKCYVASEARNPNLTNFLRLSNITTPPSVYSWFQCLFQSLFCIFCSVTLRFTEVGFIATTFADDGQHLGLVSVEVKPLHAPPTPNTLANSRPRV